MTNKEAAEVLKIIHTDENGIIRKPLEMAIKALEQGPCDDAISREQILAMASNSILDLDDYEDCEDFLSQIRELPSVTPESKTGHWERRVVEDDSPLFRVRFYCSSCGEWNSYGESEYCPNCGAKMVELQESEG